MEKSGCRGITARSGRSCEIKFKNLKARYRAIKTRSNETGREGDQPWVYYQVMDDCCAKTEP